MFLCLFLNWLRVVSLFLRFSGHEAVCFESLVKPAVAREGYLREIPTYGLEHLGNTWKRLQMWSSTSETHLVFKGQGLSDVSGEPVYDDTIGVGELHDLLLDLSYCCLLENNESNMIHNYRHWVPQFVSKCQKSNKQDSCCVTTNNYHTGREFIGFLISANNSTISQMLEFLAFQAHISLHTNNGDSPPCGRQNISARNCKAKRVYNSNYSYRLHFLQQHGEGD